MIIYYHLFFDFTLVDYLVSLRYVMISIRARRYTLQVVSNRA
jgi:hypothetical protein